MKMVWGVAPCVIATISTPALAGELPLHQPAPAWVEKANIPALATFQGEPPTMMILDQQQRIEDGQLWSYVDVATRAGSAEQLAQLSSLTLPWVPDKGDLIIHELMIVRGDQQIDILASGKTFSVLRREENLEARQITGILTATMAVEGVQIGDIVRLRYSTTARDMALTGHVQSVVPLLAAPLRTGYSRFRASWANGTDTRWKLLANGVEAKPRKAVGFTEISLIMPLAKQPDMPDDAPLRYRRPPLFEMSTFASWSEVSKTMAPLYATAGLIADDQPLGAELARLKALPGSPRQKAAAALQLVQDHIRYLAIGMNGGNYVPQTPAQTWTLRYGDCKAKTMLLLALLHGLGIEAEPVLAHSTYGDFVSSRLPSVAAFDHVIVRAAIDGKELWLDGTGQGTRIDDLEDTPPFHTILPLRAAGADLVPIKMHANARATIDLTVDADESASVRLPSVFDVVTVLRGPMRTMMNVTFGQLDEKQRKQSIGQFFSSQLGESQLSGITISQDEAAATTTLKAHGVTSTPWRKSDNLYRRPLGKVLDGSSFAPDRARPAWTAIPVAAVAPWGMRYRLQLRLPEEGKGYVIEGEQAAKLSVAGYDLTRTTEVKDGVLQLDERLDSTGIEIPSVQIAQERDRLATAIAQAPHVIAPPNPAYYWDMSAAALALLPQVKAAEQAFSSAISEAPDEVTGYQSRASFRWPIGNLKGALADIDKAIAIEPDLSLYLRRASMRFDLGNLPGALADARSARDLDPSDSAAISGVAHYLAESGKLGEALTLVDQRIALGGETRDDYRLLRGELMGTYGDAAQALALLDTLLTEKPARPSLLNARCWVKGTRSIMLDSAIKDCTSAIELSSSTAAALDSRAMIWFRLGRYDDALRDLNAVITENPGQGASRYMRGIVLHRLDRTVEANADLAAARRLDPGIDATYARFGIKP